MFSIATSAVVDLHYNVGCQGHNSGGGDVRIKAGPLSEEHLADLFVSVADNAFALSMNAMKPYATHHPVT